MEKFAHSVPGRPTSEWEPLAEHLAAVGGAARGFASVFGASGAAEAMGRLHDIGKMSEAYQRYIRAGRDPGGPRGPDHSTAGAVEAHALYEKVFGRLMGYGLAGHHSGLMDFEDLDRRLSKAIEDYTGWREHAGELPAASKLSEKAFVPNDIDQRFGHSFLARMLFSCLVDADFLETERFYARADGRGEPARGGRFEANHLETVHRHLAGIRRNDTELNRLRSNILDHATEKAALPPGLFTLTVPTGGGKTLTSLSFAAEHAVRHGLRRIIYVIPFTSIIEQTAAVFREKVGLGAAVLEHHSSFDWDQKAPADDKDFEGEGEDGRAKLRRDAENWDAPIVVTTAVQFFESLFAARTSRARKLHNIAGSVVILDEVQSLPIHLLRPCLAALDELAKNYGTSVVLCTATQPALRVQDEALPPKKKDKAPDGLNIPEDRELAPDPPGLYRKLKRVEVEWSREPVSDAAIAERFAAQPRMLCIVNSRAHARDLFERLRDDGQEGAVHLSTLMCAMHRREVLERVCDDPVDRRPVRLVSTSLIEAGVDIDFPEVWRAATGLSSVAQAAGRCNREGELDGFGRTVVFEPEGRTPPPLIEAFYSAARPVFRSKPEDLLGLEAISTFYKNLYWNQGADALDRAHLPGGETLEILTALRERAKHMVFPFATVARAFRMIDETMLPVIISYDDAAKHAIDALRNAPVPPAGAQQTLQQYVASVPERSRDALVQAGAVAFIKPEEYGDRFAVLERPDLYDEALGLRINADPLARSSEQNIFI